MRQLLLFFAVVLFQVTLAQKSSTTPGSKNILIGFNFSADYDYRKLKNDGSSSAESVAESRNKTETGKFGYTSGITIFLPLTGKIAFESGLQYSNKGYQTKKTYLVFETPDPSDPQKAQFIYRFQYIDIPIAMRFTTGKSKARFVAGAGCTINFLMKVTDVGIFEFADGRTEKQKDVSTDRFKKINLSSFVSAGLEYSVSDKNAIRIEPIIRYGLLKTIDQPISEYLWNAGLNLGLYHRLR